MSEHDTCEAGVEYESLKGIPFDRRPCFGEKGKPPRPGCLLVEFPTAEQIAEYEAQMKKALRSPLADHWKFWLVDPLGKYFARGPE
jgi:hypothetical protein